MQSGKCALGICAIAMALATATPARGAPHDISEITAAARSTPLSTWTPAQQWMPSGSGNESHGYGTAAGLLVLADELGDRLSELGRVSLLTHCV